MVSKARLDLPEPESPVTTMSLSRGISREMFLRLCTRAPWIAIVVRAAVLELIMDLHEGGTANLGCSRASGRLVTSRLRPGRPIENRPQAESLPYMLRGHRALPPYTRTPFP